jgi:hypothetical protein
VTTTRYYETPLHRLPAPAYKLFMLGGQLRKRLVSRLVERYRCSIGVCTPTGYLVAHVTRDGRVHELPGPHRHFHNWQMSNAKLHQDCPCREYLDPESGGRWADRPESDRGHHPACEYHFRAQTNYDLFSRVAASQRRQNWLKQVVKE